MAYPQRIIQTGATYYVTSRCINFEPYLQLDEVKDIVLKCIAKTQARYIFEVSSFGILDNQFRIIIRTIDDQYTISKILQHMKSMITRNVNRRAFRSGTIWNERFISQIIDTAVSSIEELKTLIFYVMYNPGVSIAEANPRKNRFNSIFAYTGEGYPPGITISLHPVLTKIWDSTEQLLAGFKEFEKCAFLRCKKSEFGSSEVYF